MHMTVVVLVLCALYGLLSIVIPGAGYFGTCTFGEEGKVPSIYTLSILVY